MGLFPAHIVCADILLLKLLGQGYSNSILLPFIQCHFSQRKVELYATFLIITLVFAKLESIKDNYLPPNEQETTHPEWQMAANSSGLTTCSERMKICANCNIGYFHNYVCTYQLTNLLIESSSRNFWFSLNFSKNYWMIFTSFNRKVS